MQSGATHSLLRLVHFSYGRLVFLLQETSQKLRSPNLKKKSSKMSIFYFKNWFQTPKRGDKHPFWSSLTYWQGSFCRLLTFFSKPTPDGGFCMKMTKITFFFSKMTVFKIINIGFIPTVKHYSDRKFPMSFKHFFTQLLGNK